MLIISLVGCLRTPAKHEPKLYNMRLFKVTPLSLFTLPKTNFQAIRHSRWFLSLLLVVGVTFQAKAQNLIVYDDAVENSWNNWSYYVTLDFGSTAVVHSGSSAIAVSLNTGTAYGALSFEHADINGEFNTSAYSSLTFWINGGPTGGQQLQVYAELDTGAMPVVTMPTLAANTWQQITLSLSSLGVANQPNFHRFSIQIEAVWRMCPPIMWTTFP